MITLLSVATLSPLVLDGFGTHRNVIPGQFRFVNSDAVKALPFDHNAQQLSRKK